VIHTVKGFGIVNKAEIDVFLELSCFFDDPVDVGNLISGSSVIPFSSCPQFFPASGSFQMSQLFTSGEQSIGVSALASVLPVNTQD
jgi:hypothetical protein